MDAYVKQISKPDKNFETRSLKSIKGTRYEVESFVKFCGKRYIEDLQGEAGRQALIDYTEDGPDR